MLPTPHQSQLKIPGLQRIGSRACVTCGAAADAFCERCGITPYCSTGCQRRDWRERHSTVCHNLARFNQVLDVSGPVDVDIDIPAPQPLRRPRSPPRDTIADDKSDKSSKKFTPSDNRGRIQNNRSDRHDNSFDRNDRPRQFDKPARQGDMPGRQFDKTGRQGDTGRQNDAPGRQFNRGQDGGSGRPQMRRPNVDGEDSGNRGQRPRNQHYRQPNRDFQRRFQNEEQSNEAPPDEDWDASASKSEPKPAPQIAEDPKPRIPPAKVTPVARANQQTPPAPANKETAAVANQKEVKPATNAKPPANAADVTPSRKLVPKNCVIETLSIGDTVLVSVDNLASECHTKSSGFICVSLHERYEADYAALCEEYGAACEADTVPYKPSPGETFSYLNSEDGGWYRARCLSPTHAALLDSSKVVNIEKARVVRLPQQYEATPEMCCVLQADVKVGDTLQCTLVEKSPNGYIVKIANAESGNEVGSGEVSRWLPTVQYPAPVAAAPSKTATPAAVAPEVPRPAVDNNSRVMIVHVMDAAHVYVRAASPASQRAFDLVLQDTALHGLNATPLTTPPTCGQYVVSKYTDGHHYRALVRRTNVKQNKYLLEYLEFGNSHINTLENLSACPEKLQPGAAPVMTSLVSLRLDTEHALTPPAETYLDHLKDESIELILTLPDGAKTAPSGSKVTLTVADKKENVNKKVEELSTPEWVKLEQRGGDVLETERMMYSSLDFLELPKAPCVLKILDCSSIEGGSLSACPPDHPHIEYVLGSLTERMGKYCESELGREPYLPKVEELCIAKLPPYPQWFRAVLAEQVSGPGGAEAEVCYVDYGNLERVPVTELRKMLPEFVRGLPALASSLDIRDFPKNPTPKMLQRALEHMEVNEEGQGRLRVTRLTSEGAGMFVADAPDLIAAMTRP